MGYIALKTQGAADLDVNNICIADLIKKMVLDLSGLK